MKMKHRLLLLLAASMLALAGTVSCGKPEPVTPPEESVDDKPDKPDTPDTPDTPDVPDTPDTPETPDQPDQPQKKTLSILAIGNSFSVDAMQYLYDILKETGLEEVVLGNLYIGGCSLATHASNFSSNSASYTYYKNTTGTWTNTTSAKPLTALQERSWDIITMQQASGDSGIASTYSPYLANLKRIVMAACPDARLVWHMTWAYQGNSTHSSFPKYNSDQMTMYNDILSAVREKVLTDSDFSLVIPCGTAVQNLRTSHFGDRITRDGYHMSYNVGRFVTAMTWAKALTGCDLSAITYTPPSYSYENRDIAAIKEAADNAVLNPYVVTESSFPPQPGDEGIESDDAAEVLRLSGFDPGLFTVLPLEITKWAYYNSSNATYYKTMYTTTMSNPPTNIRRFVVSRIFTREEIPVGSVIILKKDYQYRPEGWVNMAKNTSSARPAEVTDQVVTVSEAWWGTWTHRAFNISKVGKPDLSDAEAEEAGKSLTIFIPKP